jgi:hypothetical protein
VGLTASNIRAALFVEGINQTYRTVSWYSSVLGSQCVRLTRGASLALTLNREDSQNVDPEFVEADVSEDARKEARVGDFLLLDGVTAVDLSTVFGARLLQLLLDLHHIGASTTSDSWRARSGARMGNTCNSSGGKESGDSEELHCDGWFGLDVCVLGSEWLQGMREAKESYEMLEWMMLL